MLGLKARERGVTPWSLVLVVCFVAAGCATSETKVLDAKAVRRALSVPSDDALRVRAGALSHPILAPIELNQDDGLSPDEAGVLAVLLNPSLRVARDERGLADSQVIAAGLLPNPRLSASWATPTGGDTAGQVDAFGFGLSWDITQLIGRQARLGAAHAQKESVDLDIAWQEWQTAQAARLAEVRLIMLLAQHRVLSDLEDRVRSEVDRLASSVERGSARVDQASRARELLAATRSRRLELEQRIARARSDLNHLLGLPPDRVVLLQDDGVLDARLDVPDDSTLVSGIGQRRLDLLALQQAYTAQNERLDAATLRRFPRINIGVLHDRDTDNVHTTRIGTTIDLPIFDRGQAQVRQAQAGRQRLFDEYTSRVFDAQTDVARLVNAIGLIRSRLDEARRVEQERAARLGRLTDAVWRGLVEGGGVIAASDALARSRLDIIALQAESVRAAIALEIASGRAFVRLNGRQAETGDEEASDVAGGRADDRDRGAVDRSGRIGPGTGGRSPDN